jgi:hypothetical protein
MNATNVLERVTIHTDDHSVGRVPESLEGQVCFLPL